MSSLCTPVFNTFVMGMPLTLLCSVKSSVPLYTLKLYPFMHALSNHCHNTNKHIPNELATYICTEAVCTVRSGLTGVPDRNALRLSTLKLGYTHHFSNFKRLAWIQYIKRQKTKGVTMKLLC